MFSAWGPERGRSLVRCERALDKRLVEIEEGQPPGLDAPVDHIVVKGVQRPLRHRAAAEPCDHIVDVGLPGRETDVLSDDAADADGERPLDHDDAGRGGECLSDLLVWPRPEAAHADRAHAMAFEAESTTSSIVPSTEPSARNSVSASPLR